MDNHQKKNNPPSPARDDEEMEKLADLVAEVQDLDRTRQLLEAENNDLKARIEVFAREIKGIDISAAAAQAQVEVYEQSCNEYAGRMESLTAEQDKLINDINSLHLQINAAQADSDSSALLRGSLETELNDVGMEREIALKRIKDIEAGLMRKSSAKNLRTPQIIQYGDVMKQIRQVFLEAQNRMEVALILKQK
ncbi:MAG: hypothetical protein HQK55_03010 [Deltaproteobacteria bacterium]|nr:hypothetical protein [Deltaproteobacteria bacterium]